MKKKLVKVITGMMIMLATTACGKNEETAVDTSEVAIESLVSKENNGTLEEAQKEATASDFKFEEEDGVLTLIEYTGTAAKVTVPDSLDEKSVVAIGERAFSQNDYIEAVILPNSVLSIGEAGFFMCGKLKKIILGDKIENIGKEAFYMGKSLSYINLPDSIITMGESALASTA